MKYIHYGSEKFDISMFDEVENDFPFKPKGGLWASRYSSYNGWLDFCVNKKFEIEELKKSFVFSISKSAKILVIDSTAKLDKVLDNYGYVCSSGFLRIDFEKISKKYDAVEVLISKENELYDKMKGWDCDSIVIMNPSVIIVDKELRKEKNFQER